MRYAYNLLRLQLIAVVVSLGAGSVFSWAAVPQPKTLERIVGRTVALQLSNLHYRQQRLNDPMSAELFNEYFSTLDHNRYYFLASDIEDFASYRQILDDLLLKGNVDFAYDVYERFLERMEERMKFVRERLNEPFDFSVEESLEADRSDQPWCRTGEELDAAWRLRLKNELLTYQLMDEVEDDEPAPKSDDVEDDENDEAAGEDGDDPETRAADTDSAAIGGKTPKERVLSFYERRLRQMREKDSIAILEIFLSSLARLYDPHSAYMAPATEEDFDIQMSLHLEGIGAVLTTEDGMVKVVEIIPGGPAARDGRLQAGDRIIAVTQENEEPVDVINRALRKVVRQIRGPKGTTVTLTVIQAEKGLGSVPVKIELVRDEVKLKESEASAELLRIDQTGTNLAGKEKQGDATPVLWVDLPSFYMDFEAYHRGDDDYKSSTRDVKRLIEKHADADIQGIVLDLRSNGGGSLDEAVALSGLFFPEGPVVQARYANGRKKVLRDKDGATRFTGPLVILVDHLSASASEIVAAAMQDYGRAVIVGAEQTHGKGTVQTIFHLDRAFRNSPVLNKLKPGSLKFTMAKFYRITGGATQVKGVTPDVQFESFQDHMELGEGSLPHVLPWDKIKPVEHQVAVPFNVKPHIPVLQERSRQRRGNSTRYQDLLEDIREFARLREKEEIPLGKEARRARQQKQEEFSGRISARRQERRDPDENESLVPDDFVSQEALHIVLDLIHLSRGESLEAVAEDAHVTVAHDKKVDAKPVP